MSFASSVKEELSKINNLSKKDQVKRELIGYLMSSNISKEKNKIKYSTESEYNINRFSKLLKNCGIENFDIEIKRKIYTIEFKDTLEFESVRIENGRVIIEINDYDDELDKALIRGIFLGGGYINNPEKNYHLEINFELQENCETIKDLLKEYGIKTKYIEKENSHALYIKESEEISKFLAFIGANSSVLKFEESRVFKDTRNNVNRIINCETANMTKTIQAGLKQIEDIELIKSKKEYSNLPENLKRIAEIRLEYPEASLSELVVIMKGEVSKSGISHRFAAIAKIADELREE